MEILILGVILLVLGVGATIVYDKHKDKITTTLKELKEIKVGVNVKQVSKQTTNANTQWQKMVAQATRPSAPKKTPIRQKKILKNSSESLSADDVSINSTLTVEELIAKIEKMKKK
jgi:hypothetical protein